MTFGQVYFRLFEGMGIRRKGWEDGKIVRFSTIGADQLVMHLPSGNRFTYCPPASDLYDKQKQDIRDDWEVVK
jgi:hypothetical protein